jgi:hypothetical protein
VSDKITRECDGNSTIKMTNISHLPADQPVILLLVLLLFLLRLLSLREGHFSAHRLLHRGWAVGVPAPLCLAQFVRFGLRPDLGQQLHVRVLTQPESNAEAAVKS